MAPTDSGGSAAPIRADRRGADDAAVALRGNPWIPTLWIGAAVLVISGIAGQTAAEVLVAAPTADSAFLEYVVPAVLRAVSPWLLVAGLVAGVGVIFLHAVRWRAPVD